MLTLRFIFPQIAIAIGVLTSNKGGGRPTTLTDWTWHQGASAGCRRGAIAGCNRRVPLLDTIAGCHCSVLWLGEGDGQLWGWTWCHCWVPLQGAIVVCYGWGKVTANFGEWTWCHCWVPLQGAIVVCYGWGKVTANFGGVDVVPLLGAIAGCHCSVLWLGEGDGQLWGVDMVPLLGAIVVPAPCNGTTSTPPKLAVAFPPTIAHYNGTLQWHPAMAPRPLPQSWPSPSPNHSTLQWHPAMAPSNGTTSTPPKLAVNFPRHSTLQWHSAMAPRPLPQSWPSPSPWRGEGDWTWCHCWVPV